MVPVRAQQTWPRKQKAPTVASMAPCTKRKQRFSNPTPWCGRVYADPGLDTAGALEFRLDAWDSKGPLDAPGELMFVLVAQLAD